MFPNNCRKNRVTTNISNIIEETFRYLRFRIKSGHPELEFESTPRIFIQHTKQSNECHYFEI